MSELKQYRVNIGSRDYTVKAGSRSDASWLLSDMIPGNHWTPDRLDRFINESPIPPPLQGYGAFNNYYH